MTIEIETNKDSIKTDPYCCTVKAMVGNFAKLATAGHIPREFSKDVYFFLKEKVGKKEGFDVAFQESLILNEPENQKLSCSALLLGLWGFKNDDETEVQDEEAMEIIITEIHGSDDEDFEEDYSDVSGRKWKESHRWLRTMRSSWA